MREFLFGSVVTALYILISIILAVVFQRYFKISGEALRKMLHFIFLGAYIPLIHAFCAWWHALIFATLLLALVCPFLMVLRRVPLLSPLLVERRTGEYFGSMLSALLIMVLSVALCWGVMGERYLVVACVYAWGVGDGAAALVGVRFGTHRIKWRFADLHKSFEGSLSMLVCSFLSVFTVLLVRGGLSIPSCLLIASLTACCCTASELCTKNGLDTVICPLTAMVVILPLVGLLGG